MALVHEFVYAQTMKSGFSRESTGFLLGFVGVVIFAATLPVTRLALEGFSPWFITFGRAALAAIAASIGLVAARQRLLDADSGQIALAALFLVFGFPAFANVALQTVPAAHGGVVLGILPLATAVFAALIAGERPSALFWFASLAGAALVVAFAVRSGAGGLARGDVWLFCAGICASIGYVIAGRLSRRMPGWIVISRALVVSAPLTLAGSLIAWRPEFADAPLRAWAAFAYLGFGSMFAGFWFWNAGLAMGGIARVGQVQLLQTFFTLLFAWALLGEPVGADTIVFAAGVSAFVWLGRKARGA